MTPSQDLDDASDLRSEILRSRLLQLYLAKVMVPNPNNDTDECSSMRVEDDEADYNDRHALFDRSPDVDHHSLRSPAPRPRRDLTVSPVTAFEEEEEFDEESELPIILARRQRVDRRWSLDSLATVRRGILEDNAVSSRHLGAQRIARYLQSDQRQPPQETKKRSQSILEGGDLAVSKEQQQWLEADLHSARIAAWRSELGLRQQISRRGSLQDENAVVAFSRIGKGLPLKTPSMPEKLQQTKLPLPPPPQTIVHPPSSLSSPQCPTPPKSPANVRGKSDLKRREMNVYAPVSF